MRASGSILRWSVVVVLLGVTAGFMQARRRAEVIPAAQALASFPSQLDVWVGRDLPMDESVREVLGPGDFLTRLYQRDGAPYIDLFIAYFPSQRSGDTIHSPKNCLPGSGWVPTESGTVDLSIPGVAPIRANRYVVSKGTDRMLVIYWYQAHGRTVASEYVAKFYLATDAMRLNRTDGALVRIATPLAGGEPMAQAQERALSFSQLFVPQLSRYIPN